MTDQEVLKKAIEKATENGYQAPHLESETLTFRLSMKYGKNNSITLWTNGWIMSHSFAKAFFGEKKLHHLYIPYSGGFMGIDEPVEDWRFHLTRMVLEENPISYLRKFVEEKEGGETNV